MSITEYDIYIRGDYLFSLEAVMVFFEEKIVQQIIQIFLVSRALTLHKIYIKVIFKQFLFYIFHTKAFLIKIKVENPCKCFDTSRT